MQYMMNKIFNLVVLLFIASFLKANDEVKLTATAPGTVIMGRPFQITYTANAKVSDFKAPAITNFDVLAGPFKSESYSSQIVNGNMTSSVSISFTYTLQAQRTGTFSIPSAGITANGNKYTSNGLSIKVLPADDNSTESSSSSSSSTAAATISAKNLFIRPVLSRSSVFEQEAVKLSYKLYTTYDIVQFSNKLMPDFNGFLKQEFEQTGNTQLAYENYNGKNYLTATVYEVILYPQSAGEIIVDKATFEAIIRVQSRQPVRSIFDDFFESYTNVARSIDVAPLKINVKALPSGKPVPFSGVVGQFSINSSLSSEQVKVNEAVTLKININGSGNMKLLKNPEIHFPDALEVYDPKVINNFKTSSNGLTGSKAIEIMFIPRHAGTFEIPSWELNYFDSKDKKYKTLRTQAYSLQVLKSDGTVDDQVFVSNYTNKEDVKQIGNDIRYIFTGLVKFSGSESYIFSNILGWLFFIIPLVITLLVYLLFRKQVKDNADMEMMRNRKANRIAVKRLKYAQKMLKKGNKDLFYEEVMKAIWSYLSDKLIIPVSAINKEKVTVVLDEKGIDKKLIDQLTNILNTCEFARYAPGTGQQEMGNLYEETIQVISDIEGVIKK
jgi:hypothetical protein